MADGTKRTINKKKKALGKGGAVEEVPDKYAFKMEEFLDRRVNPHIFWNRYYILGLFLLYFAGLIICTFTTGYQIEKLNDENIVAADSPELAAEKLIQDNFALVFPDYTVVSFYEGLDKSSSRSGFWDPEYKADIRLSPLGLKVN